MVRILVTGGCGFIGSALVRMLRREQRAQILNLDKLTYAAQPAALAALQQDTDYQFVQGDICDASLVQRLLQEFQPHAIMHLAAETHVDRSIDGPCAFIQTNLVGTFTLLEAARQYWQTLTPEAASAFRFFHISTDEVYGDLALDAAPANEHHGYLPSSPYSAAKAGSDHLVQAWHRTYGLPTLMSHCSNNYGAWQYPEKLLPVLIQKARKAQPFPIYGDGLQSRDWLYVDDHVEALWTILQKGQVGERYNIGSGVETSNVQLLQQLWALLPAELTSEQSLAERIRYVADRPGHDRRYALDCSKLRALGWQPKIDLATGLRQTIDFYLALPEAHP